LKLLPILGPQTATANLAPDKLLFERPKHGKPNKNEHAFELTKEKLSICIIENLHL